MTRRRWTRCLSEAEDELLQRLPGQMGGHGGGHDVPQRLRPIRGDESGERQAVR